MEGEAKPNDAIDYTNVRRNTNAFSDTFCPQTWYHLIILATWECIGHVIEHKCGLAFIILIFQAGLALRFLLTNTLRVLQAKLLPKYYAKVAVFTVEDDQRIAILRLWSGSHIMKLKLTASPREFC